MQMKIKPPSYHIVREYDKVQVLSQVWSVSSSVVRIGQDGGEIRKYEISVTRYSLKEQQGGCLNI